MENLCNRVNIVKIFKYFKSQVIRNTVFTRWFNLCFTYSLLHNYIQNSIIYFLVFFKYLLHYHIDKRLLILTLNNDQEEIPNKMLNWSLSFEMHNISFTHFKQKIIFTYIKNTDSSLVYFIKWLSNWIQWISFWYTVYFYDIHVSLIFS